MMEKKTFKIMEKKTFKIKLTGKVRRTSKILVLSKLRQIDRAQIH
jgi:hypothetical protein